MSDVAEARRRYADDVRQRAGGLSEALHRAFAAVPREHFLGPGPWRILDPELGTDGGYRETPDADPVHLYRNVLVALDESRLLNNGEPAGLARWLQALELEPGDRVGHVGCGVGYYSAILAEVVGAAGRVAAVEVDPVLAAGAGVNLSDWPRVEVICADGVGCDLGPLDALFVNAGATRLPRSWLDAIAPGGRLLVPLTVSLPGTSGIGAGQMLRVRRRADGYDAGFVSPVGIFHCASARDPESEQALRDAFDRNGEPAVHSLRRDDHPEDPSCWLHRPTFCLTCA